MMKPYTITIEGVYNQVEKIAGPGGNSARVFVPKDWQGKKVRVLLLEPATEEE